MPTRPVPNRIARAPEDMVYRSTHLHDVSLAHASGRTLNRAPSRAVARPADPH